MTKIEKLLESIEHQPFVARARFVADKSIAHELIAHAANHQIVIAVVADTMPENIVTMLSNGGVCVVKENEVHDLLAPHKHISQQRHNIAPIIANPPFQFTENEFTKYLDSIQK